MPFRTTLHVSSGFPWPNCLSRAPFDLFMATPRRLRSRMRFTKLLDFANHWLHRAFTWAQPRDYPLPPLIQIDAYSASVVQSIDSFSICFSCPMMLVGVIYGTLSTSLQHVDSTQTRTSPHSHLPNVALIFECDSILPLTGMQNRLCYPAHYLHMRKNSYSDQS